MKISGKQRFYGVLKVLKIMNSGLKWVKECLNFKFFVSTQLIFNCLKLTIETLKKDVKCVQS